MGLKGMYVEEQANGTQREGRKLTGQRRSWNSFIWFLDLEQPDKNFCVADGPPHFNEYICNEFITDY